MSLNRSPALIAVLRSENCSPSGLEFGCIQVHVRIAIYEFLSARSLGCSEEHIVDRAMAKSRHSASTQQIALESETQPDP